MDKQYRPTILIVDDTPDNIMLLSRLLKDKYHTKVATNGSTALQVAAATPDVDLILLDVMMPGMDGWEMLQRVQERHGAIPVIMFSGKVDERSAGEAASRGAQGFIGKPFDPRSLIESTKQLLPA